MRINLLGVSVLCVALIGGTGPAGAQDERFIRSDVNQDGAVDISDPVLTLFHLFRPGFEIPCEKAADVDDSGSVDVSDPVHGLAYLYQDGPRPPDPFDGCGVDPTVDALTCSEPPCGDIDDSTLIINEIMASNLDSLLDEDRDSSDWIEIHMLDSSLEATVDLGGWFLTGDPELVNLWQFPDGVTMSRGDFLVVFASNKDRRVAGEELHTNFRLDSSGEYLALVAPDGETVVDEFSPAYPEQLTDVSYGRTQSTTTLVSPGDTVRYKVPVAGDEGIADAWTQRTFNDAGWGTGDTGLGFSGVSTEGFEVTMFRANISVTSLTVAESVISDPARRTRVVTRDAEFIDFFNSGGRGNFTNDNAFPGLTFADVDDFVILATGTVLIPEPGSWSFGVNSDDGFGFRMTKGGRSYTMSFPEPRGPADTIQTFDIAEAGPHEIRLVFYERGGGAHCELFAAQGFHPGFSNDFELVGDSAAGGLGTVGFTADIGTDLEDVMRGVNASVWLRKSFDVENVDELPALVLRMKYEDGFVAYINGVEVARRNAPASPVWDSTSTSDRPVEDAALAEEINITGSLGELRNGDNVLAIHGLNNSASNSDFLLLPELVTAVGGASYQYMDTPTPGTFNVAGSVDFVRDVTFSAERGFHDNGFDLILESPTGGARIRYTLDGSTPTSSRGTIYSGSISVDETTVIRAAAFRAGHLDSNTTTSTYLFLDDVVGQSPTGARPGSRWPNPGSYNGQDIDYGMDPAVVDSAAWRSRMEDALTQIPSISLVTDLSNLFSSSRGIYVNARNSGRGWERRTSVELLHPDGAPGFGIEAGVRIRGAFSRSGGNPKHSFRLFFRNEYGAGKLRYAMFGGEGTDEFDAIDLRTSQNYSWAFSGDAKNTFIRDVFSRDVERDMRQPYTRSRYYHLYLNGQYWGLYQTEERANDDFAESYFGGRDEDYDVIKNDSSGGRALHATAGTISAYRRLYDRAAAGFTSDAAYLRVLGLRSDGTVDPGGEKLVDEENLMDYMICTYYVGDPDAPISAWGHISNNVFAIFNHANPDGFTWYRHDAEHSLGANGGLNEARLLTDSADRRIGERWQHFNPAWLNLRLTANDEYRMRFADRVHRYFHNGGVLSPNENIRRWVERVDQIDLAVIGASARWGDAQRGSPRTKTDWDRESSYMVGTYFPQRTQIVLDQMRSVNMFPDQALVSLSQHGGEIEPGFELRMIQSNGTPGTIYYTLDGEDPRLWGGDINPDAEIFTDESTGTTLIADGAVWRYLDDGSNQGTAWRGVGFDDSSWDEGPAQLGYGDGDEATEVGYGPDADNKYATTYFRRRFNVDDASEIVELTLGIVRDDGAAVYVNGTEVVRTNLAADAAYDDYASGGGVPVGGADEDRFNTFGVDTDALVDGGNVIAVEVHQGSGTSSDVSFDLQLTALVAGVESSSVVLEGTTTVRARVRGGSTWGAMTEARFHVGIEGLVINEVLASNRTILEDPAEPGEYPDWVEIYNGAAGTIDLGGMYLTDDPSELTKWRFADGMLIDPGQFIILMADDDGTQGPFHTSYQLSVSGETVTLVDSDGSTVIDEVRFDGQTEDISYGRFPDGGAWGFNESATPLAPNSPHAP